MPVSWGQFTPFILWERCSYFKYSMVLSLFSWPLGLLFFKLCQILQQWLFEILCNKFNEAQGVSIHCLGLHNSMWVHQSQTPCKYPIFTRVVENGCQSTLYSSNIPLGFLTFTYLGLSVDCTSRNICSIHLDSLTPLSMVMPQTFGLYPFMFFK